MDGHYVPNFAMSLNDLRCIRKLTDKPLDVHLMLEHPINTIDLFIKNLRKGDTIYIHPEAEYHPSITLQKIIDAGLLTEIAVNPGTSVETIYEMLRIVKKVLVMSVNPGNASQMFLPYVGKNMIKYWTIKRKWSLRYIGTGRAVRTGLLNFPPKVTGALFWVQHCCLGKTVHMLKRSGVFVP